MRRHGICPVFEDSGNRVGPRTGVSAQVSPQVNSVTQGFVTMPAHLDFMDGAGLITEGVVPA
jgi:hypothetical protein